MAIARSSTSWVQGYANATSLTFAYNCTGSDRFLAVFWKHYGNDDITGVTYAGVAMTLIGSTTTLTEGTRLKAYGLMNPASGSNNIVISRTSANHIVAFGIAYEGVSQTGQPSAFAVDEPAGQVSSVTPDVTVGVADSWLVGAAVAPYSAGSPFTDMSPGLLLRDHTNPLAGLIGLYDSDGVVSTGTQTIAMGRGAIPLDNLRGLAFAIEPSGGGPATAIKDPLGGVIPFPR